MISYDRPLISVIVPNYNHVSFLKERIDSIIEQSYDNFEIKKLSILYIIALIRDQLLDNGKREFLLQEENLFG